MHGKWWTLLAVCAGAFMLLLDVTIVIVALPAIQRSLHSSDTQSQWVVDAYALTLASLLLAAGSLSDRFGDRRLFAGGLAVFTAGSVLCGLSPSPGALIASRAGQGIGGAAMFATALALLGRTFQGRERGVAFATWGTVTGTATALGPVLGGLITGQVGWRGIFLVNLPVGVAALGVTLWRVDAPHAGGRSGSDWAGFALLTGGLGAFVYGLIRAGETAWIDPVVVWCLGFGVVLLLVFVVVERVAAHPLFDLSLTRTPTFAGGLIAAFTMNGSLFAALVFLALYIQDGLGFSPLGTGERLLVLSAATMAPRIIAGRLTGRIGVRWFIGPGLALVGAGLLLMSRVGGADPWTHFVPGFVVAGIGSGLVNPPLASTAVGVVAPRRSGMASGVNTTFRQIGLAMSVAALGTVFAAALHHGVDRRLAAVPGLAGEGPSVVAAIRHGQIGSLLASVGPESRTRLESAVHASFAGALHEVLVVAGAFALVGGLCSFLLIRSQDFVAVEAAAGRPPPEPGGAEPVKVAAGPACEPAATGPYRNILAVVDVYRDGAAVLRRAVGLAERDNARLTLMSIVPAPSRWVWLAPQLPCDPRHELEADSVVRLRAAAGTVPALLPVIMVLRHGPPTRCLEAELSTGVYDVAIVGRPRSGRSARAAARLRRRAPVPVLVVGDQSPRMGSAVGTPDWTIPTDPSLTSSAQA